MTRRIARPGLARARAALALTGTALAAVAIPVLARAGPQTPATAGAAPRESTQSTLDRPIPYPVVPPVEFRRAVRRGTRTATGVPGTRYWQQYARYRLSARLDVAAKTLAGTAHIVYLNNSPDTLWLLTLQVLQNFHTTGVPRQEPAEITGGMQFTRVAAAGRTIRPGEVRQVRDGSEEASPEPAYQARGTTMGIRPPRPVPPRDSIALDFEWSFRIPRSGVGGRMGWDADDLFFLAYWYPQMAVYDDVAGWHSDPFLGTAEFSMGFADYDVTLDVPAGWLVSGTGRLMNARDVLPDPILRRLRQAQASDTVVRVLTADDLGPGRTTRPSADGRVRWHFAAESVRDVAFAVTSASVWDAVRASVGDGDGDGRPEYCRAEAIYRAGRTPWHEAAGFARQSMAFLSRYTGVPYPYSHVTAVEGGDIVDGGMEYPMVALIGGYARAAARDLWGITAHEMAHQWVPMIVATDERRHAWMDEGTTTFNARQALRVAYPGTGSDAENFRAYLQFARTGQEGEMMRWSDFHYTGTRYQVASYTKPASVLEALRTLLGAGTFTRAYQTYLRSWRFKHPLPWDFFNAFNTAAGQDLGWFWRSWYYETWTLDQAVGSVTATPRGTDIVVRDVGDVPMPARLTITLANGETLKREVPVTTWLSGVRTATVSLPRGQVVRRVEIDAERGFPDIDRRNNVWVKS